MAIILRFDPRLTTRQTIATDARRMYPVPHTEERYQFLQSISIGTKLVVPLKRAQLRRKVAFARSDLASAIRSELPFLLDNFITTSNTASDQVINNMRCIPLGPT